VIQEALRVLKPGGLLVLADSLQWNDNPELNWALERFPKVYHEPFYKNYLHDPLEDLLADLSAAKASKDQGFFTKTAWIQKPARPQA
jgi:SAM-dependent methyltransferase